MESMLNGEVIKQFRKRRRGLSQSRLAQILGVRRETISQWECNHFQPPRSVFLALDAIAKLPNEAVSELILKYRSIP